MVEKLLLILIIIFTITFMGKVIIQYIKRHKNIDLEKGIDFEKRELKRSFIESEKSKFQIWAVFIIIIIVGIQLLIILFTD